MYDELYEVWKKEKENEEIQPLSRDFYARLTEYLKKLKDESRMLDEKTLRSRLLQRERENVRRFAEELIRTRYNKMVRRISSGETVSTNSLTEEETALYEKVSPSSESHLNILNNVLQGRPSKTEGEEKKTGTLLVRILREIPAIIGTDMKTYGPFKPEDVAALPKENAKILIKQGAAEEIKTK